jgi:hypothetical protein
MCCAVLCCDGMSCDVYAVIHYGVTYCAVLRCPVCCAALCCTAFGISCVSHWNNTRVFYYCLLILPYGPLNTAIPVVIHPLYRVTPSNTPSLFPWLGVCVRAASVIPGGIYSLHQLDGQAVLCGGAKVQCSVVRTLCMSSQFAVFGWHSRPPCPLSPCLSSYRPLLSSPVLS